MNRKKICDSDRTFLPGTTHFGTSHSPALSLHFHLPLVPFFDFFSRLSLSLLRYQRMINENGGRDYWAPRSNTFGIKCPGSNL